MNTNQATSRYHCGLDHVYLENYPLPEAAATVSIDRVNELHRLLAEGVALRSGPLLGLEIRFLRTHLGLTPHELDEHIHFGPGLIELAEVGGWMMTRECDIGLRRLVFIHHKSRVPSLEAFNALYTSLRHELVLRIRRVEDSEVGWKHAA